MISLVTLLVLLALAGGGVALIAVLVTRQSANRPQQGPYGQYGSPPGGPYPGHQNPPPPPGGPPPGWQPPPGPQ